MADLTAVLPEPSFTPQAIGGAPSSNLFSGVVSGLTDVAKAGVNAGAGRGGRGQGTENDPVLDELAMGIFQDKSGLKLGDPGYDQIEFARRLEKAKQAGTIDATTYDIRMHTTVAELMRDNPNSAFEIMSEAEELYKIDHPLFREARSAYKAADEAEARTAAGRKALYDAGINTGRYRPGVDSEESIMAGGMAVVKEQADAAALKAQYEINKIRFEMGDKAAEAEMTALREEGQRAFLQTVDRTYSDFMDKAYSLIGMAGTDKERKEMLDAELQQSLQGIDLLEANAMERLNLFNYSFTDEKSGVTRRGGATQAERDELRNRFNTIRDRINNLLNMDIVAQERWLKSWNNEKAIDVRKRFPAEIAMVENLFGGSWNMMNDIMVNPEVYGVDPEAVSAIRQRFAAGIDKWSKESAQYLQDMTASKALPSSNPNVAVSAAGFQYNNYVSGLMGGMLQAGKFNTAEDQKVAVKAFEDAFEDVVYAIRNNYTPNSIDSQKTDAALKTVFNDRSLLNIDAYIKQGGNAEIGKMYYSQSAVAANTFLEGLTTRHKVEYDEALGKFMPVAGNAFVIGGPNVGALGAGIQRPLKEIHPDDKRAADQANQLMAFIEAVHTRSPVVNEELLKASGQTLRQLIGSEGGLAKGIEAAAEMAKNNLDAQEQSAFEKTLEDFTREQEGIYGGIDTNPFDDSSLGDGGFNSAASGQFNLNVTVPEDYVALVDKAAADSGIDPLLLAALIKNESNWNPNARGPKIKKYEGTEDEQALGIAQFLPSTARDMGVKDPLDPTQAIPGAAKYLEQQLKRFNNNTILAVMAYNWGPDNVERWLNGSRDPKRIPRETAEYVKRILKVDVKEGL